MAYVKKTIQVTVLPESKCWVVDLCKIFFWDNCFLKIFLSGMQIGYQTLNVLELSS